MCRYPHHDPHTYTTGETDTDAQVAEQIRAVPARLDGVTQLETTIEVPAGFATSTTTTAGSTSASAHATASPPTTSWAPCAHRAPRSSNTSPAPPQPVERCHDSTPGSKHDRPAT